MEDDTQEISIQNYKGRPRRSFAAEVVISTVVFVVVVIVGLYKMGVPSWAHPGVTVPLFVWPFIIIVYAIWGIVCLGVVGIIVTAVVRLWNLTPFPSFIRDSKAASIFRTEGPEMYSKFLLLLRPFESDSRLSILPTPIIERAFDSSWPPSKLDVNSVNEWNNIVFDDTTEPVELFDAIATSVHRDSQLIAIGQRKLGQRGGLGLYALDPKNWKPKVAELMVDAELIFVMPWASDGTKWELQNIFSEKLVDKAVFIMPPSYKIKTSKREVVLGDKDRYDYASVRYNEKTYRKMPIRKYVESSLPVKAVEDKYCDGARCFKEFGYKIPKYDSSGGFFFYVKKRTFCWAIPFDDAQMDIFLRWRSEQLNEQELVKAAQKDFMANDNRTTA